MHGLMDENGISKAATDAAQPGRRILPVYPLHSHSAAVTTAATLLHERECVRSFSVIMGRLPAPADVGCINHS